MVKALEVLRKEVNSVESHAASSTAKKVEALIVKHLSKSH